jgi:small subunit ribosomal protein S2
MGSSTGGMEDEPKGVDGVNVTIKDLLEAGVHFGHQTRRWDPKMKPYIFKEINGIYIIDLRKTAKSLSNAYLMLHDLASEGKTVLFVGTKRQAKDSVREDAERCSMFYVNERWLGGTLTNFKTIRQSLDRLDDLETMERDGRVEQLSKKEKLEVEKSKKKLLKVLSGIRGMTKMPSCLIIFDTKKEAIAIKEARKLGIPIIGLVDTNSNPDELDHPIPANDDAIRSIKLFTKTFSDAIIEGRAKYMKDKEFMDEKAKREAPVSPDRKGRRESGSGRPPRPKEAPARSRTQKPESKKESGESGS